MIRVLRAAVNDAFRALVAHVDPGNLRPVDKHAFEMEDEALHLLFAAAAMRLNAAEQMKMLLEAETAYILLRLGQHGSSGAGDGHV